MNNQNLKLKAEVKYRAYLFSVRILKFVASFLSQKIYWVFSDQLLRSATSIGANIVEQKQQAPSVTLSNFIK